MAKPGLNSKSYRHGHLCKLCESPYKAEQNVWTPRMGARRKEVKEELFQEGPGWLPLIWSMLPTAVPLFLGHSVVQPKLALNFKCCCLPRAPV
jgi:hypothetical protein